PPCPRRCRPCPRRRLPSRRCRTSLRPTSRPSRPRPAGCRRSWSRRCTRPRPPRAGRGSERIESFGSWASWLSMRATNSKRIQASGAWFFRPFVPATPPAVRLATRPRARFFLACPPASPPSRRRGGRHAEAEALEQRLDAGLGAAEAPEQLPRLLAVAALEDLAPEAVAGGPVEDAALAEHVEGVGVEHLGPLVRVVAGRVADGAREQVGERGQHGVVVGQGRRRVPRQDVAPEGDRVEVRGQLERGVQGQVGLGEAELAHLHRGRPEGARPEHAPEQLVRQPFAVHHETGETLPDELLGRMLRARAFRAAAMQMRQLGFAEADLALHAALELTPDLD
ncbi:MAG: hypothetical protein EOO75_21340, partial [Myxococcales bacterium]